MSLSLVSCLDSQTVKFLHDFLCTYASIERNLIMCTIYQFILAYHVVLLFRRQHLGNCLVLF